MSEAMTKPVAKDLRRFKPYPAYKDSGIEWLGKTPAHWEVRRLGSTVTGCQNGVWGDEPDGVNDIPCVRVADFDRVTFRANMDDPTMRSIEHRVVGARGLHSGDLLLEKSGGGENQPVGAVVLYDHKISAVCSNFIARVTVADGYYPRFLTYLHAALYALRINTRHIKQSTGIQNLDSASYLSEATAFPLIDEQRAIAAFLDRETARIDALVAKKERLIDLLQEKRTALITRAVTKGLDPNVPMKDSGVEWLGEIPVGWQALALKRVVDPGRPVTYGIVQCGPDYPEGIPYIRPVDMSDEGGVKSESLQRTSLDIAAAYARSTVRPGDVVLSIGPSFGKAMIVPAELDGANLTQGTARVAPGRGVAPRFLFWILRGESSRQAWDSFCSGATFRALTLDILETCEITLPSIAEQRAIAAFLDRETARIDGLVAKVREAIDRLKELRTALISAAVTGKIDVREEVA